MPNVTPVRLDRITLTELQLKAMEMALYQAADVINRLKPGGKMVYTKIEVPHANV